MRARAIAPFLLGKMNIAENAEYARRKKENPDQMMQEENLLRGDFFYLILLRVLCVLGGIHVCS